MHSGLLVLCTALGARAALPGVSYPPAPPLASCSSTPSSSQTSGQLAEQLWGSNSGYDKHTRPNVAMAAQRGDFRVQPPDVVLSQLQLMAVQSVDERHSLWTAEFWQRSWWWDPRLRYNATCFNPPWTDGAYERYGYHNSFDRAELQNLWHPSLYVENLRDKEDEIISQFWVEASGKVWVTRKVIWTLGCDMDFRWMPYDIQRCPVVLKDFRHPSWEVALRFVASQFNAADAASNLEAPPTPIRLPTCTFGGTIEWQVSMRDMYAYQPTAGDGGSLGSTLSEAIFVFPLVRKPGFYQGDDDLDVLLRVRHGAVRHRPVPVAKRATAEAHPRRQQRTTQCGRAGCGERSERGGERGERRGCVDRPCTDRRRAYVGRDGRC